MFINSPLEKMNAVEKELLYLLQSKLSNEKSLANEVGLLCVSCSPTSFIR